MPIQPPTPRALRPRSNIKRGTRVVSARHRAWINTQPCCVCHTNGTPGDPIQCAHVRSSRDGFMGGKPSDVYTVPLHWSCHTLQHQIGEKEFYRRRQVADPVALAMSYARRSPVDEIREAAVE